MNCRINNRRYGGKGGSVSNSLEDRIKAAHYWFGEAAGYTSCGETEELLMRRKRQLEERFPDVFNTTDNDSEE